MSNTDFSGEEFEFAVGSLQGLRAWNMDDRGRLHGVTHQEVWRPGENVSVCKKTVEVPCPNKNATPDQLPKLSDAAVESRPKKKRRKRDADVNPYAYFPGEISLTLEPSGWTRAASCGDPSCFIGRHSAPSSHRFDPACQCGFWAYDEASFTPAGDIIGVIDAWGKTTIGTKGFRAEKARILGISRRDKNDKPLSRSAVFRLATLYPDVQFYDDLDALIDAHDGVLRQWGEVGEDFWLQPVPEREDVWGSWQNRVFNAYINTVPTFNTGGLIR